MELRPSSMYQFSDASSVSDTSTTIRGEVYQLYVGQ